MNISPSEAYRILLAHTDLTPKERTRMLEAIAPSLKWSTHALDNILTLSREEREVLMP